jgi:hypothetical protein
VSHKFLTKTWLDECGWAWVFGARRAAPPTGLGASTKSLNEADRVQGSQAEANFRAPRHQAGYASDAQSGLDAFRGQPIPPASIHSINHLFQLDSACVGDTNAPRR